MANRTWSALVALALVVSACGEDDAAVSDTASEVEDAAQQAEEQLEGVDSSAVAEQLRSQGLNTLASAIEAVGIENVIRSQSFTLFAPRDEAWLGLSTDDLSNVLADPERAAELLQSHVVDERIPSSDLAGKGSVATASGRELSIEGEGSSLTVDGASIVEADVEVGGGVIHVVDSILASDVIESGAQGG